MSLFHLHDWALIWNGSVWVERPSMMTVMLEVDTTQRAVVQLWRCKECGKEKAHLITADGQKRIEPEWVRSEYPAPVGAGVTP